MSDRCSPCFSAAWRSPSVQLPYISTTGTQRCLYLHNKRLVRCFTSAKEEKSPRPCILRTNYAHLSLWTSLALRATYLPMSSGSVACVGRGMRVGRLAAGSDVVLRGCGLFWGGIVERGERARVLTDGAGFVGGTGSRSFAPLPAS